jgi:DNA helicase MCM9
VNEFSRQVLNLIKSGTLALRWKPFRVNQPLHPELVMRTNHVQIENDRHKNLGVRDEMEHFIRNFWKTWGEQNPNIQLKGRNIIVGAFCPQVRV